MTERDDDDLELDLGDLDLGGQPKGSDESTSEDDESSAGPAGDEVGELDLGDADLDVELGELSLDEPGERHEDPTLQAGEAAVSALEHAADDTAGALAGAGEAVAEAGRQAGAAAGTTEPARVPPGATPGGGSFAAGGEAGPGTRPAPAPGAERPAPSGATGTVEGNWVWQFASAPPPPPFLARFFAGSASADLYLFFTCGLLMVVGGFMPWATQPVLDADGAVGYHAPTLDGIETPLGALTLGLGLWLVFAAAGAIYRGAAGGGIIAPVFLTLVPLALVWRRVLGVLGGDVGWGELFAVSGTGTLFALVGTTLAELAFVFSLVRVFAKKDPAKADRAARRKKDDRGKAKGKGKGKPKGKDETKDEGEDGKGRKGRSGKDRDAGAGKSEAKGDRKKGRRGRRR